METTLVVEHRECRETTVQPDPVVTTLPTEHGLALDHARSADRHRMEREHLRYLRCLHMIRSFPHWLTAITGITVLLDLSLRRPPDSGPGEVPSLLILPVMLCVWTIGAYILSLVLADFAESALRSHAERQDIQLPARPHDPGN